MLILSLGLNAILCLSVAYLIVTNRKLKRTPTPTLTAETLMHDLTRYGRGIVKIDVIDPSGLIQWKG